MATFWRSYLHVLSKHPWKTQLATTGVLCGAGDCIAQLIVEKKELRHYDWIRCTRFTLVGFCVIGPALRTWYLALERLFGTTGKSVALKKVFFDQTIFAPIFLGNFIMLMSHLQGQKWPDIKNTMEKDYTSVLLTNYKIWPMTQVVNFYFVPFQHRILVVNVVALGWNTYLAWKANKALERSLVKENRKEPAKTV